MKLVGLIDEHLPFVTSIVMIYLRVVVGCTLIQKRWWRFTSQFLALNPNPLSLNPALLSKLYLKSKSSPRAGSFPASLTSQQHRKFHWEGRCTGDVDVFMAKSDPTMSWLHIVGEIKVLAQGLGLGVCHVEE